MDTKAAETELGMLHVYTGDGRGKTTSAIGLALRSAGAGFKVLIVQFDKGPDNSDHYSERKSLAQIKNIKLVVTGLDRMQHDGSFRFGVENGDIEEAKRGLAEATKGLLGNDYKMIILDEIITACSYSLIPEKDLGDIVGIWRKTGRRTELVLTGRGAPSWLSDDADLVTEMRKIKHYFDKGVKARAGIEY